MVSTGGAVTLTASQDLLLGSVSLGAGDVQAQGDIVLNAGRDIIVDAKTAVEALSSGCAHGDGGRNLARPSIQCRACGAHFGTAGGKIDLTAGAGGVLRPRAAMLWAACGRRSPAPPAETSRIRADDMTIVDRIVAGAGIVSLEQKTSTRSIDLGTNTAGKLGLTDAELDAVTASVLRIGNRFQ